jgi:hypothetical protein
MEGDADHPEKDGEEVLRRPVSPTRVSHIQSVHLSSPFVDGDADRHVQDKAAIHILPAADLYGRKDAGKSRAGHTASASDARPSSP